MSQIFKSDYEKEIEMQNNNNITSINAALSDSSILIDLANYGYNLVDGLRNYRNKLSRLDLENKTLNIVFLGDSITEGTGSDAIPANWITTGFVGVFREYMKSKYGDVGRGVIPTYFPNSAPLISKTGTWGSGDSNATCGFTGYLIGTGTNTDTIGPFTFYGTGIRIFFTKKTVRGKFNYSIDGGANITVDCIDASTIEYLTYVDVTGLTDGTHTISINKAAPANDGIPVKFAGFMEIKGTKGVRVHMVGRYGTVVGQSTDHTNRLISELDMLSPDLAVISFSANDYNTQVSLSTYKENLKKLIDQAKSVGSEVLLHINGLFNTTKTISQYEYTKINWDLAKENNVALLSVNDRWINDAAYSQTVTKFIGGTDGNDAVHPTAYGHKEMGMWLNRLLG